MWFKLISSIDALDAVDSVWNELTEGTSPDFLAYLFTSLKKEGFSSRWVRLLLTWFTL